MGGWKAGRKGLGGPEQVPGEGGLGEGVRLRSRKLLISILPPTDNPLEGDSDQVVRDLIGVSFARGAQSTVVQSVLK